MSLHLFESFKDEHREVNKTRAMVCHCMCLSRSRRCCMHVQMLGAGDARTVQMYSKRFANIQRVIKQTYSV